jgi:hypothetical protein
MDSDSDTYLADRFGATELVGEVRARWLATQIRNKSLLIAAYEADRLALVAQFAEQVIASAVDGEVQTVLGIGAGPEARMTELVQRLSVVLPATAKTRLRPDGSLDTVMPTGLVVTTRPEPLPGHAPGEGYGTDGGYGTHCGT